jgi:NADPH-dependent glutamate synthase beta subunit-like oxidoreductase
MESLGPKAQINKETCLSWIVNMAPCQAACPLDIDVESFIAAIEKRRFAEALNIIRRDCALPAVCARVCHHPCEANCKRDKIDEPVAIRTLARFVVDFELGKAEDLSIIERRKKERVAIIGSGPAGLAAAYDLVRQGYGVTIFEALPTAGGMLATAIPDFILPKDIVQAEIKYLTRLGLEIKTNTPLDEGLAISDLQRQGYQAILLAIGLWKSVPLEIPGADLEGAIDALSFLRAAKLGEKHSLPGKVVIIGGGNVAMNAARTALRSGAGEVHVVLAESSEYITAFEWEIGAAVDEGAQIHFSLWPERLYSTDGKRVSRVDLRQVAKTERDPQGRLITTLAEGPGARSSLAADWVIIGIGQEIDRASIKDFQQLGLSQKGTIKVDPITLATDVTGIFAAGDVASGPVTVVDAMKSGRKAAAAIQIYLGDELTQVKPQTESHSTGAEVLPEHIVFMEREKMLALPIRARVFNFREVDRGFTQKQAIQEAKRCLLCSKCNICMNDFGCLAIIPETNQSKISPRIDEDLCIGCQVCLQVCPYGSILSVSDGGD